MTLPRPLLDLVTDHACFAGCFDHRADVRACPATPGAAVEEMVLLSCEECLSFQVGVPRSALAAPTSGRELARAVTEHLGHVRGYQLAVAGYHTAGPGFWLNAVYFPFGVFLLDGSRSRGLGGDLDLLALALRHGVLPTFDPRLTEPAQFATQPLYLAPDAPIGRVTGLQDLLDSPACALTRRSGWRRVTLAQFLPVVAGDDDAGAPAAPAGPAPGERCERCGAVVQVRMLLQGSYVGCMC